MSVDAMPSELPPARTSNRGTPDPAKLAGLFRSATNSYKFLLFRTFLDAASIRRAGLIGWDELACGMARHAWWPRRVYRLSFGPNDQIDPAIDDMVQRGEGGDGGQADRRRAGPPALRADGPRERKDGILFYVPARLLSPWLPGEGDLGPVADAWEAHAARWSVELFDSDDPPLYRIAEEGIVPHPLWVEYLADHAGLIAGWTNWHWYCWLQARNPNVPMVGRKLGEPAKRGIPAHVRRFWESFVEAAEPAQAACIYSGEALCGSRFVLDHFVPHSFVEHDQVWNLVPTLERINQAKSDRLPPQGSLQALARLHSLAIAHHAGRQVPMAGWDRILAEYQAGLGLDRLALLDVAAVEAAYIRVAPPMLNLARVNGFPQWERGDATTGAGGRRT